MNVRSLGAMLAIAGLMLAPLARADAQMIEVSNCSGGTSLLVIPRDEDGPPRKGSDCAKACHSMCDRRTKALDRKIGKSG